MINSEFASVRLFLLKQFNSELYPNQIQKVLCKGLHLHNSIM